MKNEAGGAAVVEEAEEAVLDDDDMSLGNVEEEDLKLGLPAVEEETSLRRLDDGPSLTVWRGNSRMGTQSAAVSDDADWRGDSRLIEFPFKASYIFDRQEIERRSAMKKGNFVIYVKRGGCEDLMVPRTLMTGYQGSRDSKPATARQGQDNNTKTEETIRQKIPRSYVATNRNEKKGRTKHKTREKTWCGRQRGCA